MARSSNQKLKLATLLEIFLEHTNKQHPLTMKQIIDLLAQRGISAERKSIYDDIETLRLLGTDIKSARGKTTVYYVEERDFELSELKLLVDAVRASKFISSKQSEALIKKLLTLTNIYDRPSLNREIFVSNRAKTSEANVLGSVDAIHAALERDVDIHFKYFSWTVSKRKEFLRGGELYKISPWSLVWDDNNYYLIGYDTDKQSIRHFRVDKMENIVITDTKRSGKADFKSFDLGSYSNAAFGMFGGEMQRVTLSCNARLANIMLDRFGRSTVILNDGESFRITVNVIPSPVFLGWVMSFGDEVKILSPESVKQDLANLVKKNLGLI